MTHRIPWLILTALLTTALPAGAQEKYDIKFKDRKLVDTYLFDKTEVNDQKHILQDKDGKALKEKLEKTTNHYVYRVTVFERDKTDRKATKLTRQYAKAETSTDGKTTTLPYHGKTVSIEQKGDRFHFRMENGAELTGKDAEELDKEFNRKTPPGPSIEKIVQPAHRVAVGETWKLDLPALAKELERGLQLSADVGASTGTAKLLKVYKKNGQQFGVLHLELTFAVKGIKTVEVKTGSKITMSADLDVCIDGSADTSKITVRSGGTILAPLPDQPQQVFFLQSNGISTERRQDLSK